jgi:low temperature requirement protein LtrA
VGAAQVGWVVLAVLELPIVTTFALFPIVLALELGGPLIAERKARTPWHPHHLAERYGLLIIITLGEVLIGTVASIGAVVNGEAGWSADAVLLAVAGVGLAFGVWWMYFAVPWGEPLARHPERVFTFGYMHLAVFGSIAAMGAGLHVAAYRLEGEAEIGTTAVVLSVAMPVALLVGLFYALYSVLMRTFDPLHLALLVATAGCLVLAVVLAAAGVSVTICLLVIMLAPAVTVVGYEALGHRHMTAVLERL